MCIIKKTNKTKLKKKIANFISKKKKNKNIKE